MERDDGNAGVSGCDRLLAVVRIPAGLHPYAQSVSGSVRRPAQRVIPDDIFSYSRQVTGVPLQPSQAQTSISTAGTGTVTLGPTGTGTVWYPTQVNPSTTSGVNDSSTFELFIGPVGIPITLVGTLFPGGFGTIALAIPFLAPGLYLIGQWTGGNPGDVAALNVTGTMTALAQ